MDVTADVVVDVACRLGEGPTWFERDRTLRWVDIASGAQHAWRPSLGTHGIERTPGVVSAVLPTATGSTLLALRHHIEIVDGGRSIALPLRETERLNDGKVGPDGALYVGTIWDPLVPDAARLFRVASNGDFRVVLTGLTIGNGLDWFEDGSMVFVDSPRRRIGLIEFDEAGVAVSWRPIVECETDWGLPDGLTLDAEGNIWVAFWGGSAVRCFDRNGIQRVHVHVPASQTTSVAFGGDDLDTLYITSARTGLEATDLAEQPAAGALFAAIVGVSGRLPRPFDDRPTGKDNTL